MHPVYLTAVLIYTVGCLQYANNILKIYALNLSWLKLRYYSDIYMDKIRQTQDSFNMFGDLGEIPNDY
jgi:hypothetical protein